MKPVSEVITSPGTTKSFLSEEEPDKEKGFRIAGNLMSAAMLLLHFFFVCSMKTYGLYRLLLKCGRNRFNVLFGFLFHFILFFKISFFHHISFNESTNQISQKDNLISDCLRLSYLTGTRAKREKRRQPVCTVAFIVVW